MKKGKWIMLFVVIAALIALFARQNLQIDIEIIYSKDDCFIAEVLPTPETVMDEMAPISEETTVETLSPTETVAAETALTSEIAETETTPTSELPTTETTLPANYIPADAIILPSHVVSEKNHAAFDLCYDAMGLGEQQDLSSFEGTTTSIYEENCFLSAIELSANILGDDMLVVADIEQVNEEVQTLYLFFTYANNGEIGNMTVWSIEEYNQADSHASQANHVSLYAWRYNGYGYILSCNEWTDTEDENANSCEILYNVFQYGKNDVERVVWCRISAEQVEPKLFGLIKGNMEHRIEFFTGNRVGEGSSTVSREETEEQLQSILSAHGVNQQDLRPLLSEEYCFLDLSVNIDGENMVKCSGQNDFA